MAAGAGSPVARVRYTVPPAATADGAAVNETIEGSTVSAIVWVAPANFPVSVAVTSAATGEAGTSNFAYHSPAGTVTEAGGVTAGLSLISAMVVPPAGAVPLSATTTPNGAPAIVRGVTQKNAPSSGSEVTVFFTVTDGLLAVIMAPPESVTSVVEIGKLAV